jgi:proteic killer suppression protein
MIKSFATSATRRLFETGVSKFPGGMDAKIALRRLAALHSAKRLDDISPLKSVGLHPLKGDMAGKWAMTINGPWRLVFAFRDGDAWEVEITDYHK